MEKSFLITNLPFKVSTQGLSFILYARYNVIQKNNKTQFNYFFPSLKLLL